MGNIPQERSLGSEESFNTVGHAIEIIRQYGYFIVTVVFFRMNPDCMISRRELAHRIAQFDDGSGDILCEPVASRPGYEKQNRHPQEEEGWLLTERAMRRKGKNSGDNIGLAVSPVKALRGKPSFRR